MGGSGQDVVGVNTEKAVVRKGGTIQDAQPVSSPVVSIPIIPAGNQAIRFHVSDDGTGNVHFHDDIKKLKVVIPAADFWSAWNSIKNLGNSNFSYIDQENGNLLEIRTGFNDKGELDAIASLKQVSPSKVKVGETFSKLDKFVLGQS